MLRLYNTTESAIEPKTRVRLYSDTQVQQFQDEEKKVKNELLKQQAEQATAEAKKAGSFGGILSETLKPKNLWEATKKVAGGIYNIGKGIVEQYTKPSETIKQTEEMLGYGSTGNKAEDIITAPIRTIGKTFVRTFGPMLEPLGKDIAEIIFVHEISPKVASGEMPIEVFDQIDVLKKSNLQIVGDVALAVLSAYSPTLFTKLTAGKVIEGQVVKNIFQKELVSGLTGKITGTGVASTMLKGAIQTLPLATGFGGAQVLASGTKDPTEITKIMATNIGAMGILGAIISGAVPVTNSILKKTIEAKASIQKSFIEKGYPPKEAELIANHGGSETAVKKVKVVDAGETIEIGKLPAPKEMNLLEQPKKGQPIEGKGFVMAEKADKQKLQMGKALNEYKEAVKIYNEKPTPVTLKKAVTAKSNYEKITTIPKIETVPTQKAVTGEAVKSEMPIDQEILRMLRDEEGLTQLKVSGKQVEKVMPPTQKGKTSGVAEKLETKFESRVFARLKAEHPELKGDLPYNEMKIKEDAKKAIELIEKDKDKAYRIAMGAEKSTDVTSTAVNIAMSEKALADGNNLLYSKLIKNRSLEQTRRGQELVAEKGSVTDNSTARYVKELVSARLEKLGKKYFGDLKSYFKKESNKTKAIERIDKEITKAKEKISEKRLDIREAQLIIDQLACK